MALHQARQSIWAPLKASSLNQDDKSPSPSQLLFIRPSSSKNGTGLVCVRAASGEVRSPIINVATAGAKLKDVRQKVPSTSSTFITSGGFDATSPWERALADGIIDLGGLELSQERRAEVVEAVRTSAQRGFFYITNFGVESELVDQVRTASANFFALPAEEKAKVKPSASWGTGAWTKGQTLGQGYRSRFSAQGERQPSFREFFRITSQPEALKPVLDFPSLPQAQEFRDTFFKYQERLELAMHFLTGVLAEGLGLPPSYIADQYGDIVVNASFTFSPPLTVRPDSDEKLVPNLSAHTDTNFFDINVAGCGTAASRGLQYFAAGEWHDMPVFWDAAIVSIGEDWETVSNGKYHAGFHRVLRNPEAGARMSFITSVETQPDLVLAPAAELIHPYTTTPAKYRSRRRADRTAKIVKSYFGHTDPDRSKTDMVFDADLHLDKSRDLILVGGREFLGDQPLEDL